VYHLVILMSITSCVYWVCFKT